MVVQLGLHQHCWDPALNNSLFNTCRERCCYCGEPNRSTVMTSEDDDLS